MQKIQKFKMAAIFGRTKTFLKLGHQLTRVSLWVINFVEIALSSTVFEIQAFLCFAFLKKVRKFRMAAIFGG